ncbi:MAG: response regulator [Alphaproteobacteria bacterium]|nr:response regulator [Alphaproteobacteria bacterium]MCS5597466.1 response regulator [Alphaproteobacteria bacterium]|tara:strand:+ start:1730 stop:2227 length:498 start_codon:yes stop_codon:yes gene_type:complete
MTYTLDRASVLIVEDMVPMAMLTKRILQTFGFTEVHIAHDAETGFELFQKHAPDLVIADWIMGDMSGLDLVKLIRRDPLSKNSYVPIVLMTGFSHKLRVMQARDIGVSEFLVKPFTAKDLYTRIMQAIEKPRQFVDSGEFFGPDRRRKRAQNEYGGPKRRYDDGG